MNSQSRPAESEVQVTPSGIASQLQSKPGDFVANFDAPCAANSVAPSVNTNFIPNSSEVCTNAINVASMSVSSPTTVVGVPRYEETCRSHDHVPAIAQVAPLRPESDSVLSAQFSTQIHDAQVRVPVDEVTGGTLNDVNVSTRFQSSPSTAEVITTELVVVDEIDLSVSISLLQEASVPLNEQVSVTRVTPDVSAVNDSTLSLFDVKTTSTPINGDDSIVRAGTQKEESWEPRETMDSLCSNRKSCIASSAAAHNSRTTNLPSVRNGPERRSVQSRYRIFKEHFSGIMGRLDQYRSEPPRSEFRSSSRTGNPLMANVSNRSASFHGCQAIKHNTCLLCDTRKQCRM
ncbi:unnamed protein product [Angiostrongylus costaricensis]|uniref:Uncharacterized protein n=1 Tax=Angiostrongylus costaricensis TaxID=334426 RepID=A0A0R3PY81_ANGCS|nr:unnamed protein product [Angiostrongylus costaricensis]